MKVYNFYVGRDILEGKETVETIEHETIVEVVKATLKGATIYDAVGLWNSEEENTTVIEVIGNPIHAKHGHTIVPEAYRQHLEWRFQQESVLMTVQEVETHF